jgi:hypothetical protein
MLDTTALNMEYNIKTLKYKGHIVFQKLQVPSFERLPKEYYENEACFVFVNQGRFNIRTQTQVLEVNKETALLAKCLNYYYETTRKAGEIKDNVEVVGLMLYPELVKDLFDFDINKSNHTVDYNLHSQGPALKPAPLCNSSKRILPLLLKPITLYLKLPL